MARTTKSNAQPRRKFSAKKLGTDAKKPLLLLAGMAVTALADKHGFSKVGFLQEGTSSVSKFIKPVAIAGVGLVGRQLIGNETAKALLDGMTLYGGIKTVNAATGKDVMEGLSGMVPYREPRRAPAALPKYFEQPLNGAKRSQ